MQPYFFPYIGYWQLISAVDTFVIYDNIQFSKKGWFNRNFILVENKKALFSIPLKKGGNSLNVVDRSLADNSDKQIKKIIAQIKSHYNKAPNVKEASMLIEDVFFNREKNLFNYIYNSVVMICKYLEIDTKIMISSSIGIDHSLKSQDKVIAINKNLKSDEYINPIGGVDLYKKDDFINNDIKLSFLESKVPEYKQFKGDFIPYLSIIDVMMFNSKDEINRMLIEYTIKR